LFTALSLRSQGIERLIIAEVSEARCSLARSFGFDVVGQNTVSTDLTNQLRKAVRPEGVDVAIDCVGSARTAAQALAITCKGGRAILVGVAPLELAFDGVDLQRGERSVVGVQMYERGDFQHAMRLLAAAVIPGRIEPEQLIGRFELERTQSAFTALVSANVLKAVITLE
jgi:L-iditol 2-dehydrogenase